MWFIFDPVSDMLIFKLIYRIFLVYFKWYPLDLLVMTLLYYISMHKYINKQYIKKMDTILWNKKGYKTYPKCQLPSNLLSNSLILLEFHVRKNTRVNYLSRNENTQYKQHENKIFYLKNHKTNVSINWLNGIII